ncbi:hypothetical protein Ddc_12644 [Ditylenchus destructor]|nr:hypothetical protein Ddc_12644 [Ditylenchus destructor]
MELNSFMDLRTLFILLIPLSCTFVQPGNGAMMKIGELATLNGVKLETVLEYIFDSIKFDENSHQVTINPDVISQKEDYVLFAIHVKESVQDYLRDTIKNHGSFNSPLSGEKAFVALKEILTKVHTMVTTNKKSGIRDGKTIPNWLRVSQVGIGTAHAAYTGAFTSAIDKLHEFTERVHLTRLLFELADNKLWEPSSKITPADLRKKLCFLSMMKTALITQKSGKITLHPEKLDDMKEVASKNVLIQAELGEQLIAAFKTYFNEGWKHYDYQQEVKEREQEKWNEKFVTSMDLLYKECGEKVEKVGEKSANQNDKDVNVEEISRTCVCANSYCTLTKYITRVVNGLTGAGK